MAYAGCGRGNPANAHQAVSRDCWCSGQDLGLAPCGYRDRSRGVDGHRLGVIDSYPNTQPT
jgi:hypothetical protein